MSLSEDEIADKLLLFENMLTVAYTDYLDASREYELDVADVRTKKTDQELKQEGFTNAEKRKDYVVSMTVKSRKGLDKCKPKYDHLFRIHEDIQKQGSIGLKILEKIDLDNLDNAKWVERLKIGGKDGKRNKK